MEMGFDIHQRNLSATEDKKFLPLSSQSLLHIPDEHTPGGRLSVRCIVHVPVLNKLPCIQCNGKKKVKMRMMHCA